MPKSETSLNDLLYDLKRIEEHREVLTEEKIRKIYQSLTKKLNAFVGDEYIKYADKDGKMYVANLYKNNEYANFLEKIADNVTGMSDEVKSEITKLVDTTYTNCYKGMAKAFSKAYTDTEFAELAKTVNVNPHTLKRSLNNNISKLTLPHVLEKHRQEITYQIQQELNIGLINGERYEKMASRISDRVDVSYNKAMNIVRTESHRNTEAGFMDCAEKIQEDLEDDDDLVYCVTWRTMQDQRVRPNQRVHTKKGWKTYQSHNGANHIKMEGKTVKVGDEFELEATVKTKNPGSSGVARHDCNCRCFLEYNMLTAEEYEKETGKRFTKSNKNGKIEEKQGKDKITPITDKAIENVPYVGIDGYTDEQCRYIQEQHKDLLRFARDENDNKEVAFVFDNSLKNKKKYKGEEDNLEFGSALYGKDLLVMHNHPKNSGFSMNDIIEFVKTDNIKSFSVVKNNGKVEILNKLSNFSSLLLLRALDRIRKKKIKQNTEAEYENVVSTFLDKYTEKGDIEWVKINQ